MNIRFVFHGGAWDGRVLETASADPAKAAEAQRLYDETQCGTRLAHFQVPWEEGSGSEEEELAHPHRYLVIQHTETNDQITVECQAVRESERAILEA